MPEAVPVTGYVLKMYPRFSETFIVSEILAREARGERIVIFSLRPTTDVRFTRNWLGSRPRSST